jgi:hypothetical protein
MNQESFDVGVEGFAAAVSEDEDSLALVSDAFDDSDVDDCPESPDLRA